MFNIIFNDSTIQKIDKDLKHLGMSLNTLHINQSSTYLMMTCNKDALRDFCPVCAHNQDTRAVLFY